MSPDALNKTAGQGDDLTSGILGSIKKYLRTPHTTFSRFNAIPPFIPISAATNNVILRLASKLEERQ